MGKLRGIRHFLLVRKHCMIVGSLKAALIYINLIKLRRYKVKGVILSSLDKKSLVNQCFGS